jgi:hypothetical protein
MSGFNKNNILVGAANFYIADFGTDLPDFTVADVDDLDRAGRTSSTLPPSLKDDFDAADEWEYMGATQEGLEIAYSPEYGEVEIDQSKDAALMFNQSLSVTANTTLAEATLYNLLVAWGVDNYYLSQDGHVDTFSIATPDDDPVERAAVWVGKGAGFEAEAADLGTGSVAGTYRRERLYHARRIVSIEGSTIASRRTEATTFPVSVRLLSDPNWGRGGAAFVASGDTVPSDYGEIIDRVAGAADPA